jgi:hypothetical protein
MAVASPLFLFCSLRLTLGGWVVDSLCLTEGRESSTRTP